MTATIQQKIAVVDMMIDWQRKASVSSPDVIEILKAIAVDLRAETPKEIGKTLRAMTHQVQAARHGKAQLGFYDHGTMQTITEALCGRWWPVIERALQQYEKQGTRHEEVARG